MKNLFIYLDEFFYRKKMEFDAVIIKRTNSCIIANADNEVSLGVDCIGPHNNEKIRQISMEFAKTYRQLNLESDWLRNWPFELVDRLPNGWPDRLQEMFKGKAITLQTLGRIDFLKFKLFSCADHDVSIEYCLDLRPSKQELIEALPWVSKQTDNPLWVEHVEALFKTIATKLGYDF